MDRLQMDIGPNEHKRSSGGLHPGLSTRQSNTGAMVSYIEYVIILVDKNLLTYCGSTLLV